MTLFINKISTSKTFSNSRDEPEAFRRIHQHAQVFRFKARAQRQRTLTSLSSAPLGWLKKPSNQSSRHDGGSRQIYMIPHTTASASYTHSKRTPKASPRGSLFNSFVLCRAPLKNTTDPFAILPICMDIEKHNIVQYFLASHTSSQWNAYDHNTKTTILKACLSEELHFYCFLTIVTARMKYVTKDLLPRPDLEAYFMLRAISLMRQHLLSCRPFTQQIILDMFFLATAEFYHQNWPAVFIHRTACKHGIEAIGGFSKLDPLVQKILGRGDLLIAAATSTQPILELCLDPGPLGLYASMHLSLPSCRTSALMGAGFFEELGNSSNKTLLEIIGHVTGFASTMQSFWSGSTEILWDSGWMWARASALIHRLLSLEGLPAPGRISGSETSEQQLDMLVEECTRFGIVIWLSCGLGLRNHNSSQHDTSRVMMQNPINFIHMQERLIRIMDLGRFMSTVSKMNNADEIALPEHCMLVLWILGLNVLVTTEKEDLMWLSRHFIAISRHMGIMKYEEFEHRISTRYLWLRSFEEASDGQLTKVYNNA